MLLVLNRDISGIKLNKNGVMTKSKKSLLTAPCPLIVEEKEEWIRGEIGARDQVSSRELHAISPSWQKGWEAERERRDVEMVRS